MKHNYNKLYKKKINEKYLNTSQVKKNILIR